MFKSRYLTQEAALKHEDGVIIINYLIKVRDYLSDIILVLKVIKVTLSNKIIDQCYYYLLTVESKTLVFIIDINICVELFS